MDYDGSDHDGSYVLYVKFFSNSVEDILEIFAKNDLATVQGKNVVSVLSIF